MDFCRPNGQSLNANLAQHSHENCRVIEQIGGSIHPMISKEAPEHAVAPKVHLSVPIVIKCKPGCLYGICGFLKLPLNRLSRYGREKRKCWSLIALASMGEKWFPGPSS